MKKKILFLSSIIPQSYLFWKIGEACSRKGLIVRHVSEGPEGYHFLSQKNIPVDYLHFCKPKAITVNVDSETIKQLAKHQLTLYADKPILQQKVKEVVPVIISRWERYLDEFCPDYAVINNGSGLANESLVYVLRYKNPNAKVWCSEAGFVPNTFYLDKETNNKSSLMDWDINIFSKIDPKIYEYIEKYRDGQIVNRLKKWKPLGGVKKVLSLAMWYPEYRILAGRVSIFGFKEFIARKYVERNKFVDPYISALKPYIFLPLQVAKDTQVLHNSYYIHDMPSFIDVVANAIPQDKFRVVIKDHPADRVNFPFKKLRDKFQEKYPHVVFVRNYSSLKLVLESKAVVTLNSTVGFEGVLCNKPVFCLGEAWYAKPGIAHSVKHPDNFKTMFDKFCEVNPDKNKLIPFFSYILFKYLLPGNYQRIDNDEADIAAERILKGSVPYPTDDCPVS